MKYAIFFNKNAGNGQAEELAQKLLEKLSDKNIEAVFLTAPDEKTALEKVKAAIDQYDAIVSIGGDGTLNIVVTAFVQKGKAIPLGILPGGTVNNFARHWQIPLDMEKAMQVILRGKKQAVGVGVCEDERHTKKGIVSSFTFGAFADMSNDVRQSEKKKWGLIIYPIKALKQFGKGCSHKVLVKTDEKEERLKVWFSLITTTYSIGGFEYIDSSVDKFHMSILNNMTFGKLVQLGYFVIKGKFKGASGLTYIESKKIELTPLIEYEQHKIFSRIDGDKGPELPLKLEYLADFVPLFVPSK
ncbi:diacylglycerol/lipid kinase family protein [Vagococcus entomophilus]|uniref:Lipid kinase n=1 Tax=Vagococcus entomophilus TaxID=1160095 RepID=A0A430AHF2_9ENTE|nr:diacylglycerol kinase family protein [Vagococcus entomophilus]RSU07362.1 lipid kinase [Vagococcus entomophilus]